MFSLTRVVAIVATVAGLAAMPAIAGAQSVPMRGVVSGSPYGASSGQMAVPVLFSKMTARNSSSVIRRRTECSIVSFICFPLSW